LVANERLPIPLFDLLASSRLLLRVHVASDQPLPVLCERLGRRVISP
jgi:hypothetical protein